MNPPLGPLPRDSSVHVGFVSACPPVGIVPWYPPGTWVAARMISPLWVGAPIIMSQSMGPWTQHNTTRVHTTQHNTGPYIRRGIVYMAGLVYHGAVRFKPPRRAELALDAGAHVRPPVPHLVYLDCVLPHLVYLDCHTLIVCLITIFHHHVAPRGMMSRLVLSGMRPWSWCTAPPPLSGSSS